MTNFKTRCDNEARTHELIETFASADDYYTTIQCVKMAVRAMWALQFSAERIGTVASALGNLTGLDAGNVQIVLTRMTRAGVLRSKVKDGKRFYEVNY
jgi:hypothetical protein